MNILLVGNAGNFMRLMINRLNKEGHRVFVLTEEPKKGYSLKKVFEVYHFSYEDACVREVLESIMPQVVVFLGAYDHNFSWNRVENTAASYAAGRICGEFVMCYPPGIPILAPGEMITPEIIEYIVYAKEKGCSMQGTEDPEVENLNVLAKK
jgi:arginine/lysine/ornithine decarboxylase